MKIETLTDNVPGAGVSNAVSAPATPLSIGIVGLVWGSWIIKQLQRPENQKLFRVAAVCDLNSARAVEEASRIHANVATFEELLEDPSIRAIGLFTGPSGRAELIRRAIRAGKHVMTTKPFERDCEAAVEVLKEAEGLGRAVHLNSPSPLLPPDLACLRSWQKKYQLGRPVSAQFSAWVRYHEKPDGRWYDNPDACPVAPIFRIGIYLIYDAIELFGEPDEVYVQTSRLFTGRATPDHAQMNIRFKNGSLATILASFCVADAFYHRNSAIVNFENGTAYRNVGMESRDGAAGKLYLVTARDKQAVHTDEAEFDSISGSYQWKEFHKAVLGGIPAPADYPSRVVAGLRVVEAMAKSEKLGLPVKIHTGPE